ncbi:MAG TPA: hypothetical protein DCE42_12295 [Myxococcales bacterium]|nr:hypothetical protein [Deltaproteobacteria bacterium]MBU49203.1 hypothetical protein [Deltaproteobacteria bacterium]HAA55532.1 hypothetical protein [Myxococcales bacterium]
MLTVKRSDKVYLFCMQICNLPVLQFIPLSYQKDRKCLKSKIILDGDLSKEVIWGTVDRKVI